MRDLVVQSGSSGPGSRQGRNEHPVGECCPTAKDAESCRDVLPRVLSGIALGLLGGWPALLSCGSLLLDHNAAECYHFGSSRTSLSHAAGCPILRCVKGGPERS